MAGTGQSLTLSTLPKRIPVFPLTGALLLPKAQLPLNIFEPRYLAMVNDAMSAERIIGMIQPGLGGDMIDADKPALCAVGCAGRITAFAETPDGRNLITLTGVCRFAVRRELPSPYPYRIVEPDFTAYAQDLEPAPELDRTGLFSTIRDFLKVYDLKADWEEMQRASTETLVNTFSILAPCSPQEKQALLEANDLKARSDVLKTLTDIAVATMGQDGPRSIQ
ncbi:MAG: LON peptidase substrate-binding domain-containing protein [Hyphomicrobiales bacterium]